MVKFETNLRTYAENTIINYAQLFNNINQNCSLYSLFNILTASLHCIFLHHVIVMLRLLHDTFEKWSHLEYYLNIQFN